jgi:hypothetical protein
MELTDSEREEFVTLANATFDPGLWHESELPILRKAKADREREQGKERGEVFSFEQPTLTEVHEDSDPEPE